MLTHSLFFVVCSLSALFLIGWVLFGGPLGPTRAKADSNKDCEVSEVKASVLSDSYDRQSNTWTIQLTWAPPIGSCQQYIGYSVEVYYDSEGQWLGYNWVPSLATTSISPALFPNATQKYRVRPQSSPQREASEAGSWAESNSVGPQASPPVEAENKPEDTKKAPKKPTAAPKAKAQAPKPPKSRNKAPRPRNIVIVKRPDKKKPRGKG